VQGKISLGDMTLYLTIFRQGQSTFQGIFVGRRQHLREQSFMANLSIF